MRYPVILAGGSGVRLWPASRSARPKQFLSLGARSDESLLAATARRVGPLTDPQRIRIVTASAQVETVRRELPALGANGVIAEPVARNTAPALGLAALHLSHDDPDAVMAILPADHYIADEPGFVAVAERAFAAAEQSGAIVTVGIVPTRAETGYGYLRVGAPVPGIEQVHRVERFVEKPDRPTAEGYLASGDYLWNGGMFFVRAQTLLAELSRHQPDMYAGLSEIRSAMERGQDAAAEVIERVYPTLTRISMDYAVMEHADDVLTVSGDFGWNDVGSWAALGDYRPADQYGNVIEGAVVTCEARDNIVICDDDTAIALVGVTGLVVVKSGDGLLVVPRERAQEVRAAVASLRERDLTRYL